MSSHKDKHHGAMEMDTRFAIIGAGVAGITAAQSIARTDPRSEVHVFGDDPHLYYRRPLLWEFIAGALEQEQLFYRTSDWYEERGIHVRVASQAIRLEPERHTFVLADQTEVQYDRLLLATGGRPFVPPCSGSDTAGAFTLRTLDDAKAIKTYASGVTSAIVVGGGLLGLETGRALASAGLEVRIIEVAPHLLPRQLDAAGARVLESLLASQGLEVVTDAVVEAVLGHKRVAGVRLRDGREFYGELVLFSTGIRSETRLARAAGIEVERGVVADEHMRTSVDDIYAAGDVAEFQGRVYGIIPPAVEQARVAAQNMVSDGAATYDGTLPATTLKVAGAECTSVGEATAAGANGYEIIQHADVSAGHYRRLVLQRGRIVGAVFLNDPVRARPTARLIEQGIDVSAHINVLLSDDFDLNSLLPS
jgi:nitrite reductase (NADH) large subunit